MKKNNDVRVNFSDNDFYILQEEQLKEAIKNYCEKNKIAPAVNMNDSWISDNRYKEYLATNNITPEYATN